MCDFFKIRNDFRRTFKLDWMDDLFECLQILEQLRYNVRVNFLPFLDFLQIEFKLALSSTFLHKSPLVMLDYEIDKVHAFPNVC